MCFELLEKAYLLKKQCEESDKVLRNYLLKSSNISNREGEPASDINDVGNEYIDSSHSTESSIGNEVLIKEKTHGISKTPNKILTELRCDNCSSTFEKMNQLKLHMRVHKKKLLNCKTCLMSVNSSYELTQHNKLQHSSLLKKKVEETTHLCSVCEEKFSDNAALIDHMLLKHTEKRVNISDKSKELICNICNKTYLNRRNLMAHMGTHTGNKPFQCNICEKRFTQGRAFACHMRTHSDVIEKPYKCNVCQKEFAKDAQLAVHMKKHSGQSHTCNICGKSYSNSGKLRLS